MSWGDSPMPPGKGCTAWDTLGSGTSSQHRIITEYSVPCSRHSRLCFSLSLVTSVSLVSLIYPSQTHRKIALLWHHGRRVAVIPAPHDDRHGRGKVTDKDGGAILVLSSHETRERQALLNATVQLSPPRGAGKPTKVRDNIQSFSPWPKIVS